jgi:Uma2 family endonuclease
MILPSGNVSMDPAIAKLETVAELLEHLGDIPAERVRWQPLPGTATEKDVLAALKWPDRRLCELVDGTLVEKPMGFFEARLGGLIFYFIESYLGTNDLGFCLPADATLRILPQLVRLPDVCFISWQRLPTRELPAEAVPDLVPDLAVEVLSESNTRREMERKRREYFQGGARLVWELDPRKQTARVYTNVDQFKEIGPDGSLEGGDVLPGFVLPLQQLFARAGRQRGS